MKILFLAHRVPYPPNKGDKIRSFNEIKYFSQEHEIHLFAFCDDQRELKYKDALNNCCRSVTLIPLHRSRQQLKALVSLLKGEPWTLGYYSDTQMCKAVNHKLESTHFDLLFAYSSSVAPYIAPVSGMPKFLDFVDSDASKWRQYAAFKPWFSKWLYVYESRRLAEFEKRMVEAFDCCVFVSPRETGHIQDRAGKIAYIQNGIDLDYYAGTACRVARRQMVFVGAMDYFPNIDAVCFFAREILPRLRAREDVRFVIVGNRPARSVRRLARLPGVTVTGAVDDVRPFLSESSVAVVPVRIAQGIQNKVLEALAAGLPVVATRAAAEGLAVRDGLLLSVADEPAEFADCVLHWLSRPPSVDQILKCRQSLNAHYSWDMNLSEFCRLFQRMIPTKT